MSFLTSIFKASPVGKKVFSGAQSQGDAIEKVDPMYKKAVQGQIQGANQFRAGLPQFKQDQMGLATQQGKLDLANSIAKTRSNLSGRGLLYGGMRQGAEAKQQAGLASDLANKQVDINQAADQTANQLDYGAAMAAQGLRDIEQGRQNAMYDAMYNKSMGQQQMFNSLLSGGSAVGGAALAKGMAPSK